ncbi:ABC transporter permease [Camelimonas abortus]|uniref:ABC transporter permease n=1 Tax=Camelimonas abortus TaxID=1017184 RepID=A0ABV7LBV7_9HYPH
MSFWLAQFLTGLASAASLFLVASGLSIIFGVTRVVNFAHGAFYMLGAYVAWSLTERLEGAAGWWAGVLLAAALVALAGAMVEVLALRRIYHAPELFQLLATFGVTLIAADLVVMLWGPDELVGRRAPGLTGSVEIAGQMIPAWDLFLIVLGPATLAGLWLLFNRTRWGVLVRAATQDREMAAALGVNEKWLFTGVFTLGAFLAALAGALQLPRESVNHHMDMRIIVDAFVVVVIGGLGSIPGAFVAAVLVALLNAFGILLFPKISLVIIFLVMAATLAARPWGLLGRPQAAQRGAGEAPARPWRPLGAPGRLAMAAALALAAALPFVAGDYLLVAATETLAFAILAVSLHFLLSVAGVASFGHAAFFGLGAYAVALAVKALGSGMPAALALGLLAGLAGAAVFALAAIRLSGVYLAMLTLAFAQILWSIAFQWVEVTGGDNGVLGLWPEGFASEPAGFYWLTLAIATAVTGVTRALIFAPFGYALRATRDSDARAATIGLRPGLMRWLAFVVAGAGAGLAGALFAFLKGSVFPDVLGIPVSVDALVMALLGGVQTTLGPLVGAVAWKALSIWLLSQTQWSKLALGIIILCVVLVFPGGLAGVAGQWRDRRRARGAAPADRGETA